MFPEKHIRYIAVAENEGTEKGLSDFVPFRQQEIEIVFRFVGKID